MNAKAPTPQGISALLRKAGFDRAVRLPRDGNTRGFKVAASRFTDGGVTVNFWEHSDYATNVNVHRDFLDCYAETLTAAGWAVQPVTARASKVVRHLIVTAPETSQCPACHGTGAVEVQRCNCAYPDTGAQHQHEPHCGLEPCPRGCEVPAVTAPESTEGE